MAIDFSQYQTPGVYTESVGAPQLGIRSSVPTAVAIFGLAVGYQTYRESIRINPDTGETITTQILAMVGGPTGGSFTLSLSGETTSNIPFNATQGQVQSALRALPNLEDDEVTVTGDAGGPWTVVITKAVPAFGKNVAGLTGGDSPDLNIASEQTGVPAMNRALAKRGIKTDTIRVVDPNSGQVYVLGTDYVVTRVNAGEDGEANTRDDLYTIQRVVDGGHIDPGDIVQLSYRYTDPNYHEVIRFTDPDDIRDFYGDPFDAAGNIQSEITLAAQLAITNGASTILACAVDPEDPDAVTMGDYQNALNKFRDEDEIAIIVSGTGAQPIQALVQQHVSAQSNNKYERRAILGMDGSVTPVPSATRIANAQSIKDQRIALISPSSFTYYAPELNREIVLGGQYMAAAVAGKSVSAIAAMPLTRKVIRGFVGPAEIQRDGEKARESSEGLMVVEKTPRNQVHVRHGVTTDPTSLHTREWNIIGQQDVMVYRIRDYLDADGLIGMPIYDTTIVQVKASAEAALVWLVDNGIIRGYRNLKARQIERQPDVIEVRYEWRPAYPLNYIVVRYSIAPETGDITSTIEGTTSF
ncbi:tail sheath [Mycobacterium phage Tonenili]|uniref:Tail sheath protein n=1 Tax=Mycobacterium phage Tonenili TaxID=1891703 RepID=A0A1C9EHC2_9CAUD|nr:tail sheath [Mycobacterium phage Tonenili]AON96887.1 tail sheath protein [Mycobacterium phage Tonenili]